MCGQSPFVLMSERCEPYSTPLMYSRQIKSHTRYSPFILGNKAACPYRNVTTLWSYSAAVTIFVGTKGVTTKRVDFKMGPCWEIYSVLEGQVPACRWGSMALQHLVIFLLPVLWHRRGAGMLRRRLFDMPLVHEVWPWGSQQRRLSCSTSNFACHVLQVWICDWYEPT